jgi:hypothetical protein
MSDQENVVLRSLTPLALNMDSRSLRAGRRWVGPTLSALAVAAGLTLLVSRNSEANSAFHALVGHASRLVQRPGPVPAAEPLPVVNAGAPLPAAPAPVVEVLARAQVALPAPAREAADPLATDEESKPAEAAPGPAKLVRHARLQRAAMPVTAPRRSNIPRGAIQPAVETKSEPATSPELMAPTPVERDTSELIAPYDGGS